LYSYQRRKIDIHAAIKLRLSSGRLVDTTVGRVLLFETLPEGAEFDWINRAMKKRDLTKLVARLYKIFDAEKTVVSLDKIKKLGFYYATTGGISLSLDNLVVPEAKEKIIEKAKKELDKVEKLYVDGAITNGERFNKVVQIWARTTEDVANEMIGDLETQDHYAAENKEKKKIPFNPVFMMLDSGARGSRQQIRQLGGMRGLMAKPSGEIMETPVLANFRGGLSVFEYFISTHGARKGLADTALKTADSGYLTRRLVDVAQDVVVTQKDCNALGYVRISDLKESGDILRPLGERVFSRVLAEDIKDPLTGKLIARQGEIVTEEIVEKLNDSAVTEVSVRSVLTCQAKRGVCAICYGLDLSTSELVDIGTAVGIIAAQSIGEPGTQLTMRTFHVGGTASGLVEQNFHKTRFAGKIQFRGVHAIEDRQGRWIVMNRKAKIAIISDDGRELELFKLEYGTHLLVSDGQQIKPNQKIAEWDLYHVIMSDKTGRVQFIDLIENVTCATEFDEAVGKSTKVVLENKAEKRQPCIAVIGEGGEEESRYFLPTGAHLYVEDGGSVLAGDVLAKLPREEKKTKDITGGLPRVAELFEARIPKDSAVISEVDGVVQFGGLHRGQRRINVTTEDGEVVEYNVPRSKHLNVEDGENISAGDQLTAGVPNAHDILRILGPDELQKYLVAGIQEIYTLQGVTINDKHIELIVRQMLRKVRITDAGDTNFIVGDRVDKIYLQTVNTLMIKEKKKIASAKPILMGITKASLGTESWVSAASFQETTRVLTEAAIMGQVDCLYGLKENVTIGKLIPAGTGVPSYKLKHLGEDISELEQQAREEEQLEISLDEVSLSDSSQTDL
jgi:DNA-directed RNA polymerase subunit beta'